MEDHADFLLVVTDEQGKPLAHADLRALSTKGVITGEQMLTFLESHTVPVRNAKELLAKALQQAKQENKRVLVQETATWCGPCRLLSRYLTRERKIWERDYIWVKLDHRWTGTREVIQTLGSGPLNGIPWCVILDKNGKVLVTSNDADGKNIGFPAHQSSRAHFRKMLEKTAIRLNSMEINELVEALTRKQD
jgi:thiol-disulfide isomerase/thioredoxin